MNNLFGSFIHTLYRYKFTILSLIYYCIIVIYPIHFSLRLTLIVGACSIFFIHNIIAKTKFSIVFVILLSIIISFNAYIAFTYSSYVQIGLIASIMETSQTEAASVMKGVFLSALLILTLTTILIYLSIRELKHTKLSRRKSLLILLIYCYALLPMMYRRVAITDLRESYNVAPVYVLQQVLNHYSPLLYGNALTIGAYINEMYTFREYSKKDREMAYGINPDMEREQVSKIFIVIGESSTRSRFSLYGYSQPTTPFADSLHHADPNKLYFYDGVASASYTRNAVPNILSTGSAKDVYMFYKEKTFIDLAKLSGYQTAWFSNQARIDLWSAKGNYIGNMASQTDHSFFSMDGTDFDDFELLDYFQEYYKNDDTKQVFIFHLIGSHYHYSNKYDDVDRAALPGQDTEGMMYDRSLHHTDRLLKQLYALVAKSRSAAMLYVSDHGEDVGVAFGHGIIPISKVQFEVPFLIFNNTSLPIDSIAHRYVSPIDSTLSNANAMYILTEMIGYSVSNERAAQAINEGQYVVHGDDVVHKFVNIEKHSLLENK